MKNKEKLKKVLGVIWGIFQVIIIFYVVLMTLFILFKNQYGYTQFGNYTLFNVDLDGAKNNTGFIEGDLIAIENSSNIKEGDLIYYYTVENETYVIRSSEVVKIEKEEDNSFYYVDGSSNSVLDSKIIGKKAILFPHLGSFLTIVCSQLGFIFLVLLPILVVFGYQIFDFIRVIRRDKKELDTKLEQDNNEVVGEEKLEETKEESTEEVKEETKEKDKEDNIKKNTTELFDDEIL